MNKIKDLNKLYQYKQIALKHPILTDLFLEVTSRCNARCEHCGSRCGDIDVFDEIKSEDLKRTLFSISIHYQAENIFLNITGGEPLVRKDLFSIMDYAVKLGFHWGMTSNGMLITDEILDQMQKTNMETISISLDGLKETHEKFRNVQGCFDKIITNIQKLQNIKSIKIVQVTTVANKKNINELEDLYQLMKQLNIKSWRVVNVDPIGRAKDNQNILLNKEDYQYLFNFIKEKRNEKIIDVEYGCSHYLDIPLENEIRSHYFYCPTGINIASILSNGDIFVCPNVERRKDLIQGNIKVDNFVNVWENKYKQFRSLERTRGKNCYKCHKWKYCLGDSFHTFDYQNKIPMFCINEILENK